MDRFVWFILIGVGFFALQTILSDRTRIVSITPDDIEMLQGRYIAQTGVEPDPGQTQGLIDHHVREEILVREAQRVGLDRDDVIVRRRLAQKMELSIRDGFEPDSISEEDLRSWYGANPSIYSQPRRVAFRHVFLGGAGETKPSDIAEILSDLNSAMAADAWRKAGKPFMLALQYGPRDRQELSELFGARFADNLLKLDAPNGWIGPVQSSYGQHLVQLVDIEPEGQLPFEAVRERIRADMLSSAQEAYEDQVWRSLLKRYRVKVVQP